MTDKREIAVDANLLGAVWQLIEELAGARPGEFAVLGICGAQGSGKSTLAKVLLRHFEVRGIAAATLSLDDLYLTKVERIAMARRIHPLFETRGVPGTHDVALGIEVIAALARGEGAPLPRFDKGADDRLPEAAWPKGPSGCQVLIFEGWCVGARPQPDEQLAVPLNTLEINEDPRAVWRNHANAALGGVYQRLFARIDRLLLLAAPGFEVVHGWRLEQERDLLATAGRQAQLMDAAAIARFIQHYERLTRHILAEMPSRADLVARLGSDRAISAIERRR